MKQLLTMIIVLTMGYIQTAVGADMLTVIDDSSQHINMPQDSLLESPQFENELMQASEQEMSLPQVVVEGDTFVAADSPAQHISISENNHLKSTERKNNQVQPVEAEFSLPRYTFEFTGGVLWPTHRRIQKIYGKKWPTLQVKGSFAFAPGEDSMFPLYGWAAVSYTATEGRSLGAHERTNIKITPLSFGLRTMKAIDAGGIVLATFGLGVQACFVHTHNRSNFVPIDIHKVAPSGIINIGLYAHLHKYAVVSGVLDYNVGTVGTVCTGAQSNVLSIPLNISHVALRFGFGVVF